MHSKIANQLTGFYMRVTLAFNGLKLLRGSQACYNNSLYTMEKHKKLKELYQLAFTCPKLTIETQEQCNGYV